MVGSFKVSFSFLLLLDFIGPLGSSGPQCQYTWQIPSVLLLGLQCTLLLGRGGGHMLEYFSSHVLL
jgi:hypothetical protein